MKRTRDVSVYTNDAERRVIGVAAAKAGQSASEFTRKAALWRAGQWETPSSAPPGVNVLVWLWVPARDEMLCEVGQFIGGLRPGWAFFDGATDWVESGYAIVQGWQPLPLPLPVGEAAQQPEGLTQTIYAGQDAMVSVVKLPILLGGGIPLHWRVADVNDSDAELPVITLRPADEGVDQEIRVAFSREVPERLGG